MTRDRRLLLLLGLLMAYGLFVVECHQHKDATTEARHRHRHKHESSNRRSHHDLDRRSKQEVDYEYDGDTEEDSTAEDDYEMPSYHDHLRSYLQRRSYSRMFEPRYPAWYHGGGYYGNGWYDKDSDRRKISSRYNAKNRRYTPSRSHHGRAYSHNHDVLDYDDNTREDFDHGRSHRYVEDGATDRRPEWRRNARRYSSPRREWRNKTYRRHDGWRHRLKDRIADRDKESKWTEYWRKRSNSSEHKLHMLEEESKSAEDEDYKDHGGLEESDKDDEEEEDDIWKTLDNKDEENDEVEELDNDFYKSKSKSALTYDDIIRRLTFDDPTTVRTTVKRDYRNIEDRHAKRVGYRHFKYEPRNVSRVLGPFTFANRPIINRPHAGIAVNSSVKSAVSDEPKSTKNVFAAPARHNDWQQERRTAIDGTHSTRTKSKRGNLDNDGYLYGPDNEKEDDLITDEEEDSDMQADVTDTGYADDDNEDEDAVNTKITTAMTKTTTTTTKRPFHQYNKNTRPYGRNTAAEYNGHQPKNDYPPMSAHSVQKWQTLGSRESVKQTMNSMRQSNNGEHAANHEASLYWNKVKEEGSCKWPRAKLIRVSDFYPDSSVSYYPHCAILHECSDNTGCCQTDQYTCVASKVRPVELTFYAKNMNGSYHAVRLTFNNHTECECKDKMLEMQRINQSPQNVKITPSIKPCKCTKYFIAKRYQGDCRCECPENSDCKLIGKGKKLPDFEDRECIRKDECTVPTCEFGTFRLWEYRCPAKKDTLALANRVTPGPQNQTRKTERRIRVG